MRILWLDKGSEYPWVEEDAWSYVEQSGFTITKVQFPVEAREHLNKASFEILVVRAEVDGAMRLLEEVKCHSVWSKRTRVIVISNRWKKEDFEEHAKMFIAADKYFSLPQPKVMFVQAVREVLGNAAPAVSALTEQKSESDSVSRLDELFSQAAMPALDHSVDEVGLPPAFKSTAEQAAAQKKVVSDSVPVNPVNKGETGPIFVATPLLPGIAKNEQDVEVIRQYLHMREEELAILLGEKQELSRENSRLQKEGSTLQTRLREVEHSYEEMSRKVIHVEKLLSESEKNLMQERENRELEAKSSLDKNKFLETQLSTANERYEELKNRVRKDIRKIRMKERDLEAKLDIARRDTETLLSSRDKRVLEMQRKIDALEFDLDQVQDSRIQAESEAERYLAKLSRVARALHLAVGMIEEENAPEEDELDLAPLMGGAAVAPETQPMTADMQAESSAVQEVSDDHAALATDGEPTRVGSFHAEDLSAENDSQVINSEDDEKAIG